MIETAQNQKANRQFIKRAMAAPMLEKEHEVWLATRWRDKHDQNALHELITAYMRLVVSIAGRYRNYGLPMSDLIQEGNVGLMQAATRFEPERDVRFSTYASWWVRAAMQDYILRNWSIVRTGTTTAQKTLFFNLRRLKARIHRGDRAYMTDADRQRIADMLHVAPNEVAAMETRMDGPDRSLNIKLGESGEGEGSEWQDFLVSEQPLPEDIVMEYRDSEKRHVWLEKAIASLNERERFIIRKRQLAEEATTLEALGARLGISKERVRQIESQALRKLKTALKQQVPDPVGAGLVPA